MDRIIVSRHPAAIEFVARELGGNPGKGAGDYYIHVCVEDTQHECGNPVIENCYCEPTFAFVPVIVSATADDVRGKHVYGNIPLHLAALATGVTVVEFEGEPPRGQEYSLADMDAAGAVLRSYTVHAHSERGYVLPLMDARRFA